jgi:hypothetical protein
VDSGWNCGPVLKSDDRERERAEVGAARVVQTLSFEFTDDVCDGESTRRARQRSTITTSDD